MKSDPTVYVNSRGLTGNGQPLDGHLDGWGWVAFCDGGHLAYGATEDDAARKVLEAYHQQQAPRRRWQPKD